MGAMRVEYSTQYNKPGAQEGTQQSFILGGSAPAFSLRFYSYKCILAFWAFLPAEVTDFPTLSYTSTSEIATLSYAEAWKMLLLSGGGPQ